MKANIATYCILSMLALSCNIGGKNQTVVSEVTAVPTPQGNHFNLISSKKDLDLTNTTFTLSNCSVGVVYVTTPQPANNVQLPTPNAPTITCDITLSQLAYNDSNNDHYTYTPETPPGLTGNITITQSTGGFNITAPTVPTAKYIGGNTIYTGSGSVTAYVTFSIVSNQVALTWNVNAPITTTTMTSFSPTGGNGGSGNTGNAVPPTVTSGNLLVNPATHVVTMTLKFINNSGAADSSQASQASNTIYQAKTVLNTTAGPQCYLFYDQSNIVKPSWYNLNSSSTLTSSTDFTLAQVDTSSNYGYFAPVSYATADALFQAAQTTSTKSGISATGISAQIGYYIASGSVILSYLNCYNLLNYSSTNWGGLSQSPYDSITTSFAGPDLAKYAWFAVLANNLNSSNVAQNANAYTVVNIPKVTGE